MEQTVEFVIVTADRSDPRDLKQMIQTIQNGRFDAMLTQGEEKLHPNLSISPLPLWHRLINEFSGRPELGSASLANLPFALPTPEWRSYAGLQLLRNPVDSHLRLIRSPYRIGVKDSSSTNLASLEQKSVEPPPGIEERLAALLSLLPPPRGGWNDGARRRDIVDRLHQGNLSLPSPYPGRDYSFDRRGDRAKSLSVIIPARNEEATIGQVIQEIKKLAPNEIVVVINGSSDQTETIARGQGATTISFEDPLGTDVGRAIGAFAAQSEILLFVDGDFVIPWQDLVPFVESASTCCDVAVNQLNHHLRLRMPVGTVTALKYALNTALGRADLENASLVHVPFAINRRALEVIHWTHLQCPPKAYALGLLGGLHCLPVHQVEVDRLNRYRHGKHDLAGERYSQAAAQIIGDHIEAMHTISDKKGGMYRHDEA
ncbi:glycosyltransferase family 2 protein [Paenibacillus pectinilyticus]|uniref:glycosyltransferase family 2 protein n=1 Tax=Paenibacillus pectinilyticus TaxID=512399 RepID=UPI0014289D0A|nr:glycosyltransferase [Paenibacillus pectinilyticus]